MKLRKIQLSDAPEILSIYAPSILDTAASFELCVPTLEEVTLRIQQISKTHPWWVAEENGKVIGYTYASEHRSREAYQWSVETTVYVHPENHKKGIACQLYTELFKELKELGFYSAYAGVTIPNEPSVGFHLKMGFKEIGKFQNIGFKFNQWHDVAWFEKSITPGSPKSPPLKRKESKT